MNKVSTCNSQPICFELPRRLFGRQEELDRIYNAYETVLKGQFCAMFVHGYAGTGKTALVYEAARSLNLKGGHFIAGKSDQLQQNIPYAPFTAALGNLVRQLLSESPEELGRWKKKILRALGHNGAVVAEIVPELKWVIGEQPAVDDLPPKEAQNRFLMAFVEFIRVLACKGQPLVLFLDDLQWADPATIHLLSHLIRNASLSYILFIGALRDNEAKENQPLIATLMECDLQTSLKQHLYLMSLSEKQIAEFTAEVLDEDADAMVPLAAILHRKSGGNPFYLRQLLLLLYHEQLLYFDEGKEQWQWNQEGIQDLQLSEDVLLLLLERLQKLPAETLEILKLASCMGNRFNLGTLTMVCGKTLAETNLRLTSSILEGLVLPIEDRLEGALPIPYERQAPAFVFVHDRVQQAVYSLIPEGEKKQTHLLVGRLLLRGICEGASAESIQYIMDHFNRSLDLLSDSTERVKLAEYNLMAGRKARVSAAYDSALEYFKAGNALLPPSAWESAYPLTFELHLELAQTEYLSASGSTAEALFDIVIAHAKTDFERAQAYGLKVVLYAGIGKYSEAVRMGLHVLCEFGVKLPIPPRRRHILMEILLCIWYLLWQREDGDEAMAHITTPVQAKASEMLARLACIISIHEPSAYLFTILKTANYATRYGNADMSAIGYMGYGIVAGSVFGRYDKGHDLALVGLRLADRSGKSYAQCYVNFVMGAIISHWTKPAAASIPYLQKAVESGLDAGDLLLTVYASRFELETSYLCGQSLDGLMLRLEQAQDFANRAGQQYLALNTALYRHITGFLREGISGGFDYDAGDFKDTEFVEALRNDHASQAAYHILRMQMQYLSGNYEEALSEAESVESRQEAIAGFLILSEYNFYHALTLAALCQEQPRRQRTQALRTLRKDRRTLGKWAKNCPENFSHKHLLIAAEQARMEGKLELAMNLYDQAIEQANAHGYTQDEALANERAALFHLGEGRKRIARAYLEEACARYGDWGALAKAQALCERYATVLGRMDGALATSVVFESEQPSETEQTSLAKAKADADLDTLHRAIRLISAQADPSGMLGGYLELAMESTGADRGILMLEKNSELWIEAERAAGGGEMTTQSKPIPMEKSGGFSKAMVRYAFRTLETTVWREGEQGIFFNDPYLAQTSARSIACLPVLLRSIPAGVLYLECISNAGVLDGERLQLPKLLSEQLVTVKKLHAYLEERPIQETQAGSRAEPLTGREADVLRLIAAGYSNREIAEKLGLTANTVKGYIKNLYGKLNASRRVQIVARAKALGLLKAE